MRLCINIDHFATLREARGGLEPDPVTAALICELHGADGIVCHLREDRRHINDRDLRLLRETVRTKLDLEMAVIDEILDIAVETLPDLVTLVPEKRKELTTESGLDVITQTEKVERAIRILHDADIEVSLFVDPVVEQIEVTGELGADMIEIHTGEFANARSEEEQMEQLERIRAAASFGKSIDLGVNAGHGLDYNNIGYIAAIPEIDEISIGHSLVARAMFVGLPAAVEEMRKLIRGF